MGFSPISDASIIRKVTFGYYLGVRRFFNKGDAFSEFISFAFFTIFHSNCSQFFTVFHHFSPFFTIFYNFLQFFTIVHHFIPFLLKNGEKWCIMQKKT